MRNTLAHWRRTRRYYMQIARMACVDRASRSLAVKYAREANRCVLLHLGANVKLTGCLGVEASLEHPGVVWFRQHLNEV